MDHFDVIRNKDESLSFSGRESNTQNKPVSRRKSWKKTIIAFLISFFLFCTGTIAKESIIGKPYPAAETFLVSAKLITYFYTTPTTKLFGVGNWISIPGLILRDALYNQGISLIPKNDAEREVWWGVIKFEEYLDVYNPLVADYADGVIKIDPQQLLQKTDDIYSHLKLLANIHYIKDPKFMTARLKYYANAAWRYLIDRRILIFHLYKNDTYTNLATYNNPFLKNSSEIEKVENVLSWYANLKDFTYKYQLPGYRHFFNGKYWMLDAALTNYATTCILASKIVTNKFNCSDLYVDDFRISRSKIFNDILISDRVPKKEKEVIKEIFSSDQNLFVLNEISKKCGGEE